MEKEDLRLRTIINLKELLLMLENNNVCSCYSRKINYVKEITTITKFDRVRIQTAQDLVELSKLFKE